MKTKTLIVVSLILLIVGLFGPSLFSYYLLNNQLEGEWFWAITMGWFAASVLSQFILNRRLKIYKNAIKKDSDKTKLAKFIIISSSVSWAIIQMIILIIFGVGVFGGIGFLLGLIFHSIINNIIIEGAIITFLYIIALIFFVFKLRILSKIRNL